MSNTRESKTPTPYAVVCLDCGVRYLTKQEYLRQMEAFDDGWECPSCRGEALFDEEHYVFFTKQDG